MQPATLWDQICDYIEQHGPATILELATATGKKQARLWSVVSRYQSLNELIVVGHKRGRFGRLAATFGRPHVTTPRKRTPHVERPSDPEQESSNPTVEEIYAMAAVLRAERQRKGRVIPEDVVKGWTPPAFRVGIPSNPRRVRIEGSELPKTKDPQCST